MRYIIRAVTPATDIVPIVSLEDAKAFMKVDTDADDGLIERAVLAAQEMVEAFNGEVLTPRELEMVTGGFPVLPELISLPRSPVTSIISIKYSSADTGAEITLDPGAWRWADTSPDQVLPAFRQPWPVSACEAGSVRIRFTAGYDEGLCPFVLTEAVKRTALQLYDSRSEGGSLSPEVQKSLRRPLLF